MTCKCSAVDVFALFVQCHQDSTFGNQSENRRSLFTNTLFGIAGATFRDFMDVEAAEAALASDIIEASTIAISEFPLRTLLETANGNDDESHARTLVWWFRSSLHCPGESAKRTSEPKPH